MRIGIFSDVHGNPRKWDAVNALAKQVDILLSAGDITPIMKANNRTLLTIYGNHDSIWNLRKYAECLNDGFNQWCGITIFAINGNYAGKKKENWHQTQRTLKALFSSWGGTWFSIALTHEPPHGAIWRKGKYSSPCSQMVSDFYQIWQPDIWFYGHCYMKDAIQTLGGIRTVNVNRRFAIWDYHTRDLQVIDLPDIHPPVQQH